MTALKVSDLLSTACVNESETQQSASFDMIEARSAGGRTQSLHWWRMQHLLPSKMEPNAPRRSALEMRQETTVQVLIRRVAKLDLSAKQRTKVKNASRRER